MIEKIEQIVQTTLKNYQNFNILTSDLAPSGSLSILPDLSTCEDCMQELFDPNNRRYLYPFINCTNCGPRYSIIESMPYDRIRTSMKNFQMCALCEAEYNDPNNRRFHAQPNACFECGPHLEYWNQDGQLIQSENLAIKRMIEEISEGKIIAVKGLGGFHLMVDASNCQAIQTLRRRKNREEKPFAVMFPSMESIQSTCIISDSEKNLIQSNEKPIVIVTKKNHNLFLSPLIAPDNPNLGVMLPYTPLHALILHLFKKPMVATSGNIADDPICIDENDALKALSAIADGYLIHNRPILRYVDDSICRIVMNRPSVLRRARSLAPLSFFSKRIDKNSLGVGGHLKNTIAITSDSHIHLSPHIGDLKTLKSYQAFCDMIQSVPSFYQIHLDQVVSDFHPDYLSSQYAKQCNLQKISVQHHYAHVLSCMADNELDTQVMGVAFDGTGHGLDQTIWGGEFLLCDRQGFERKLSLRPFQLPGITLAIREPRRSAIGLLYALEGDQLFYRKNLECLKSFESYELKIIQKILLKNLNTSLCSSMGRFFDAIASLLGIIQISRYEAQAAMMLEFNIIQQNHTSFYSFDIIDNRFGTSAEKVIDFEPMIYEILNEMMDPFLKKFISCKFHRTISEMIIQGAKRFNCSQIVLTGGCFQNKYLLEYTVKRINEEGLIPYWHQRIPCNDGGIALGQVYFDNRGVSKLCV